MTSRVIVSGWNERQIPAKYAGIVDESNEREPTALVQFFHDIGQCART